MENKIEFPVGFKFPAWGNFIAVDEGGHWCVYQKRPIKATLTRNIWNNVSGTNYRFFCETKPVFYWDKFIIDVQKLLKGEPSLILM